MYADHEEKPIGGRRFRDGFRRDFLRGEFSSQYCVETGARCGMVSPTAEFFRMDQR